MDSFGDLESLCLWNTTIASIFVAKNQTRFLKLSDPLSRLSFTIDLAKEFLMDETELRCLQDSIVVIGTNSTKWIVLSFNAHLKANLTSRLQNAAFFDRATWKYCTVHSWDRKLTVSLHPNNGTEIGVWLLDKRGLNSIFIKSSRNSQNTSLILQGYSGVDSSRRFQITVQVAQRIDLPSNKVLYLAK